MDDGINSFLNKTKNRIFSKNSLSDETRKMKIYETDYNFFTFLKVDSSCRESCGLAFF